MKTCSLHRLLSGLFPDTQPVVRTIRRHAAGCPECRHYLESLKALEHNLSPITARQLPPLPPALRRRILRQAKPQAHDRMSATPRHPLLQWRVAGAAAAVCLAGLLALRNSGDATPEAPAALTLELPLTQIPTAPPLERLVAALENPLAAEIDTSIVHGRQLLAGMVRSAVPEPAYAAVLREARSPARPGAADPQR